MFLSVYKLVPFFHINEYVLIKQENPIYITVGMKKTPYTVQSGDTSTGLVVNPPEHLN